MSEIICYNHECRGNLDWCCKNGNICNPDNCEWKENWQKENKERLKDGN